MKNPEASILYVEDDDIVREIVCSFITAQYASISIYSAGSAEGGLELFRKHRQSIIMTDINLAGSDGLAMARSIRTLDPETVIIFITGSSDVERLNEFKGPAPCHCICKPLMHHKLFMLLDSYLKNNFNSKRQKRKEHGGLA